MKRLVPGAVADRGRSCATTWASKPSAARAFCGAKGSRRCRWCSGATTTSRQRGWKGEWPYADGAGDLIWIIQDLLVRVGWRRIGWATVSRDCCRILFPRGSGSPCWSWLCRWSSCGTAAWLWGGAVLCRTAPPGICRRKKSPSFCNAVSGGFR